MKLKSAPGWAKVAAAGLGLISVGLLVYFVGLFVPSTDVAVATLNYSIALVVLGAVAASAGLAWRLLRTG